MNLRYFVACFSAIALLGAGAMLLRAQPPQSGPKGSTPINRDKLRAQIIQLRTETEMLRLDYELARDGLVDAVKTRRGLKLAGGLIGFGTAIQNAMNQAAAPQPNGAAPQPRPEPDSKKEAESAKAAEDEEKKDAAEEAAFIAERKKELSRLFSSLAEKSLDLEDAERRYREISR